jgi:hypothetical protein
MSIKVQVDDSGMVVWGRVRDVIGEAEASAGRGRRAGLVIEEIVDLDDGRASRGDRAQANLIRFEESFRAAQAGERYLLAGGPVDHDLQL